MQCLAMLFNLESRLNKEKTGTNSFLTFVDVDTGESFQTYVTPETVLEIGYQKMKVVNLNLAISLTEYKGKPQLSTRILSARPINTGNTATQSENNPANVTDIKPEQKAAGAR
jgi:hypothetical protein